MLREITVEREFTFGRAGVLRKKKKQQLPLVKDDNISSSLSYQLSFMEINKLGFFILSSGYLRNIVKSPNYIVHNTVPEICYDFKFFVLTGYSF